MGRKRHASPKAAFLRIEVQQGWIATLSGDVDADPPLAAGRGAWGPGQGSGFGLDGGSLFLAQQHRGQYRTLVQA